MNALTRSTHVCPTCARMVLSTHMCPNRVPVTCSFTVDECARFESALGRYMHGDGTNADCHALAQLRYAFRDAMRGRR